MIDWNDMKFVLAIHRGGTLSEAARQLNVDQTTVTRRLKLLEQQLNVVLFNRVENKLIATQSGEALLQSAEMTEVQVDTCLEEIAGTDLKCQGNVRITSVPLLMNQLIAPALNLLIQQNPGLTLELIATAENLQFSKRQTDIAVRFQRPQSGMAVCRKITSLSYSVYYKSGYNSDDLPFIGFSQERQNLPQAIWLEKQKIKNRSFQLQVDDAQTALSAVLAGAGRGLFPDAAMRHQKQVCLDTNFSNVLQRELWLLVHPDIRHLKRIKVVSEYLYGIFNNNGQGK